MDDMRVRDLVEVNSMVTLITEMIGMHALDLILASEPNDAKVLMEQAISDWNEAVPDDYWSVSRLATLSAISEASERILEGLKATQPSRGKR